jgi:uncharacterized protein YgiM (DUF1202 family)
MKKPTIAYFAVTAVFFLLLFSCGENGRERRIELPSTPIISSYSKWAVVTTDYLRIRSGPGEDSAMLASTGMGAVARILSRAQPAGDQGDTRPVWYQIEIKGMRGWVVGTDLRFFGSESEARTYAEGLQ